MDWVSARDDPSAEYADLSRPPSSSHGGHPDSGFVNTLLAPMPSMSMPSAPDWPAHTTAARDAARHDLRFEFSLNTGPDFDTDSPNDDLELPEDDDLSSDLRGAVSTSDDTSVVTESMGGSKNQGSHQHQHQHKIESNNNNDNSTRLSHLKALSPPPPPHPPPPSREHHGTSQSNSQQQRQRQQQSNNKAPSDQKQIQQQQGDNAQQSTHHSSSHFKLNNPHLISSGTSPASVLAPTIITSSSVNIHQPPSQTNNKTVKKASTPRTPTRIAPKREAIFEDRNEPSNITATTTTTTNNNNDNDNDNDNNNNKAAAINMHVQTDNTYSAAAAAAKSVQSNDSSSKAEMSDVATTPSIGVNSSKGSHHNTSSSLSRSPSSSLKASRAINKRNSKGNNSKNNNTNAKKTVSSSLDGVCPSSMSGGSGGGGNATAGTSTSGPSHTKLCRDRLNNMFDRLKLTLPAPPPGVEVKHKAQVLDYAIMVFKGMVERTAQLEIELAVSSNKATMEWISKLVQQTETFPEAAKRVMRLFIVRRGWLHAELWTSGKRPSGTNFCDVNGVGTGLTSTFDDSSVALSFCDSVENESAPHGSHLPLRLFSEESKGFHFRANEGVQGRVWSSMRPEWVTGLSDSRNFRRAELARKYGLKVCLAVPITITGKIEGIMCFYDVRHRPYDTQCLELAMRLAWALGNAIGGKRAQVNVLSTSGTSDC